jgi:hypothetical protein
MKRLTIDATNTSTAVVYLVHRFIYKRAGTYCRRSHQCYTVVRLGVPPKLDRYVLPVVLIH